MVRPIDRQKCIKSLKKALKPRHVSVTVNPGKGKGSHISIIFTREDGNDAVSVTITGDTEVSPGVQRNLVEYIKSIATRNALAAVVREAFRIVFGI